MEQTISSEKTEPETIAANLRLIVDAMHSHNPSMPVVLCAVFPSSPSKSRSSEQIRKINDLYQDAIVDEPQVTFLDTWSLFDDVHGDAKEAEMPDLLHPNILGYAKWSAALHPVLEAVGLIPAWPDNFVPEHGFTPLFNGSDLSGWSYEGGGDLRGMIKTADGRFEAMNGRLIVPASHTRHDYRKLWTARSFSKDFVLKLEFRASPNADSGIYVREPQLQCRDFLIAGPFATLKNYRPLDWNEIVVTVRHGLAHCTCNGEILVDAMPVPSTGPIGLESDRGQMEYRRIQIQESR